MALNGLKGAGKWENALCNTETFGSQLFKYKFVNIVYCESSKINIDDKYKNFQNNYMSWEPYFEKVRKSWIWFTVHT